jgi:hypothetical protein
MAVIFLVVGYALDLLPFIPSALIVEDMVYYVANKFDKPDTSESITDALGFILGIPVVWLVGIAYTVIILFVRF